MPEYASEMPGGDTFGKPKTILLQEHISEMSGEGFFVPVLASEVQASSLEDEHP